MGLHSIRDAKKKLNSFTYLLEDVKEEKRERVRRGTNKLDSAAF